MSLRAFAEGVAISVGQVALLEEIATSITSFLPRDDSHPDITKWNRYYAALGESEKALDWLERSIKQGRFRLSLAYLRIRYGELQEEPRFQALLKNVGLDDESLRKAEEQRSGQVTS